MNSNVIEEIFILDSQNNEDTALVKQCFDIVNVFVAAVDLEGKITLINRKGCQLLELQSEEIIGRKLIPDFISENQQQQTAAILNEITQSTQKLNDKVKYHFISATNEIKIIEARNIPIRDKENNVLGTLISGEDVTNYIKHQHELQYNLELYRILARNIPDINLYLFDLNQRFIIAEGTEMKNNGFESSDFENKKLTELHSKSLQNIWAPYFDAVLAGKEIFSEYKFNNYYYLIWVIPVKNQDNKTVSGIAITQNITDDKRAEQKLMHAKEIAEKANRAKSDFLARVSHEIRTPLNAILGFTEQLKQTQLDSKQDDYVKIIDKSSEHLLSLINDILVLSKIEAQQINFEDAPFKIGNTVKYVHNALLSRAEEKGLNISFNIDPKLDLVVLGDSFRLRQVLINMLSNAIKFTNSGYVELRCFLHEDKKNEIKVRFDVIDTGIGIKPDKLQVIFEQFKQADSNITKKYGGTGLGLTICKNLIDMQGGGLSVSSQVNMGTTFSFILPYKKGGEADIVSDDLGEINPHVLKGTKVLLVDDDSVNRLLGKTILEKFKCKYDIANNGKEAIEKLDTEKYDIVLLDIHMPDVNGIDVAKYFRKKKINKTTKIVAVTAAVMKDDIQNYFKAGINDFLVKPFKEIHLFNKICEVLQYKKENFTRQTAEIILKEEIQPRHYDLTALKSMTGNNKELLANMLKTFIENSEQALTKFHKALATKNTKLIAETAHKILPSYRHLEVNFVVNSLLHLKEISQNNSEYEPIEKQTNQVIKEVKKILDELRNELLQLGIEE
ncbi:MAG TPA: response regulator [Draconibacterium sp.]|nr:response regulator [Draconibacterium sp.]